MMSMWQFVSILVPIFGILVAVIIALIKFSRNTVTKEDLNNSLESLRSEVNTRFDEIDRRFAEAAADRKRIEETAALDREKIRDEARTERQDIRDEARTERQDIRVEARAERQKINTEIVRQNQNYIDHLAYHNVKPTLVPDEDDD